MDPRAFLEPKKHAKTKKAETGIKGQNNKVDTKAPNPSTSDLSPSSVRTYDPRALLNPRGHGVTSLRSKMEAVESNNNGRAPPTDIDASLLRHSNGVSNETPFPKRTHSESGEFRGLSMLESVHGAERRAERPVKKVKANPVEQDDKSKKSHGLSGIPRRNAGVGTYFKSDPNAQGATDLPIDLTADDDADDDVEITKVQNIKDSEEICYGMLDAKVLAYKVPKPQKGAATQFAQGNWPIIKCELKTLSDASNNVIQIVDPHGLPFGNVEEVIAVGLAPVLKSFATIRTQPRVLSRPKKRNEWAHQPCSDRYRVVINVYGERRYVKKIGQFLGQRNVWLRQPMISDSGISVENPHAQKTAMPQNRPAAVRGLVSSTRTVEEATNAVSSLFDAQAKANDNLVETDPSSIVTTELLSHQKQALTFMLRREQNRTYSSEEAGNSSLWRKRISANGRIRYEEVVTGLMVENEPPEVLGGLLADVMGLGKTIEALALVATTLDAAKVSASNTPVTGADRTEDFVEINSRATLIVAPVSTVKNWEDQIKEHIQPGGLKYYVYHGATRTRDIGVLADNDVVIATYSTIAAEFGGRNMSGNSIIRQVRWYRIMLDEAHTIREPKATQTRVMYSLAATRRWCLTGTPIQNRMEDLGSLTSFLRLYPYETVARFNQYVRGPAQSGDPGFLKTLGVFIDSFTLRRLRDRIELPERIEQVVDLQFSPEERKIHEFFRTQFSFKVQEMFDEARTKAKEPGQRRGGSFRRVLEGIMILRLICDHGRELLKQSELDDLKGQNQDEPIDLDDEVQLPMVDRQRAHEHFSLLSEASVDFCSHCNNLISGGSPSADSDDGAETVKAYVLPCLDTVCVNCFTDVQSLFDDKEKDGEGVECPFCGRTVASQYIGITKSYADEAEAAPEDSVGSKDNAFRRGIYTGPSTKVKALLQDIAEIQTESAPLVAQGQAPIKCIVFSEFTSYLDVIERALQDNGHKWVRIDGSMSLPKRRAVLDALNEDNEVTIMLASIKAAGQGLNLTAASRAFIMEPMWNPAAEAQAVDRIYRIGQKRRVVIKRYHMVKSMEDKIMALQDKKRKLADMSMNRKERQKMLSGKERTEESLKAMLDVFKI